MLKSLDLLNNIDNLLNNKIRQQARKNRDYDLFQKIHYQIKDGNPELYDFFTTPFSADNALNRNNISFEKKMVSDIENLRDLFLDPYTVFYDEHIENNIKSLGLLLKNFLIILKTWRVEKGNTVYLEGRAKRNLNFEEEMNTLDEIKETFIRLYSNLYFQVRKVL